MNSEASIPVIDTHQHLWDLQRFHLPWLSGGGPLAKDHLLSDYLTASEGLNIKKTIYMEVDVDPSQKTEEAEYVLGLCKSDDNPMAGAVIGGDPSHEGFQGYIRPFIGNPYLKGVRQVLHGGTPPDYCLQEPFLEGVRFLGENGLRFDICIYPTALNEAARMIEKCPETRFILDHCGNGQVRADDPTEWKRGIEAVARHENVICKISGIVASSKPGQWTPDDLAPIILHCADSFGRDRIVFGSDWPVCTHAATYRQWVEALQTVVSDWEETDRRKLFHDNALRFYELE